MPRLPRHLSHSFWAVLDTVCYPLLYFALTPMLIRYMGPVVFGFWMLLNTVVTVLTLFNFNFGVPAMRPIAEARAVGNTDRVRDVINSLLRTTVFQFVFLCVLGLLLCFIISRTEWSRDALRLPYGPWCFFLAAVLAGLKFFEQLFQNILKAYEQFRSASLMNILSRSGALIISLLIAMNWPGLIFWVLLGNIFISLAAIGLQLYNTYRLLPFYHLARIQDRSLQWSLLQYSLWPWLQSIFVVLTFQTDRFWVTAIAGLREVSLYALVATMFNHIHMIFSASVAWAFPQIVGRHAREEGLEAEYRFINSLLIIFSTLALASFYLLSPGLMAAWVGEETYLGLKPYVQSFTAFELAFVHTIMPMFLLNGTGRERQATFTMLICCAFCFTLMLAGLWYFKSPVALVQGMTLGACLSIPFMVRRSHSGGKLPLELLPTVAMIVWIYAPDFLSRGIALLLALLGFWRFYFVHLKDPKVWRQLMHG
jgi:O-antigen/teichoic acid export membrane protein